jgi:glycosyltransferase involved in cell wall biosynthesis
VSRPRIAIVVDVRNWAFHNIAQRVADRNADEFDIDVHFQEDHGDRLDELCRATLGVGYDLVHYLRRHTPVLFLSEPHVGEALAAGETLDDIAARFAAQPVTVSVHDHLFLDSEALHRYDCLFDVCTVGFHVSSQRLARIYSEHDALPAPDAVIEDGVDHTVFAPRNIERLADTDREIVIGWAGNSAWNRTPDDPIDYKGLDSIIRPAIAAAKHEGHAVRGTFRDRQDAWLPAADVPRYFDTIDIYACASLTEGTATPVLEAMACGLPVVSTDVGIVPELFGPLQRQFLIAERSVEAFADAIGRLATDPALRLALSVENLERSQFWNWDATADGWGEFFRNVLAHDHNGDPASPARRACCDPRGRHNRLVARGVRGLLDERRWLRSELDRFVEVWEERGEWIRQLETSTGHLTTELEAARNAATAREAEIEAARNAAAAREAEIVRLASDLATAREDARLRNVPGRVVGALRWRATAPLRRRSGATRPGR